MNYYVDIQHACDINIPVTDDLLTSWINNAIAPHRTEAELTLRIVSPEEMIALNYQYRKQNKTTNVLAFPSDLPPEIALTLPFLGDIIICPTVLEEESIVQNTPLIAHWAHIVTHGVLHLLGFDHQTEHDTAIMRALEVKQLLALGFVNPYEEEPHEIG